MQKNPEIAQYTPGMIDVLVQRLIDLYVKIMEETPSGPVMGRIHNVIRQAREMKAPTG